MKNPTMVTMSGPLSFDASELNDFEAGIAFLALVGQTYPGAKFSDLPMIAMQGERMEGWLTDIRKGVTKAVTSVKDGIGDTLKSTFNIAGDAAGSTVRLLTDEEVLDGASRIGAAYATYGGSEGVNQMFSGGGGSGGESGNMGSQVMDFISKLGGVFKGGGGPMQTASMGAGGLPGGAMPWLIGGGVVLALLVTRGGGDGRRR